jgi:tripartite-type tricarboxylate transporter receptor subunit TctC
MLTFNSSKNGNRGGAAMRRTSGTGQFVKAHGAGTALILAAALTAAGTALPERASAQQYPSQTIHILVGFNPSSSADVVTRMVGKYIENKLGQPVIVENRTGNSSMIAAETVARAANDGYTLFTATVANTIYPARTGSKFDLGKDMQPIALLGSVPGVLVINPKVPAKNMKELAALMKSKPETLTYGTSGVGTSSYLAAEMLNLKLGTKVVAAHYQGGSSQRIADLLAGRVNVAFNVAISVAPQIKAGKLRAIAVAQKKRAAILPDVPTLDEAGIHGIEGGVWIGLLAPAGTPKPIVAKLSAAANEALKSPEVVKAFQLQGIDVLGGTPQEFASFIDEDIARWTTVLKALNLPKAPPKKK